MGFNSGFKGLKYNQIRSTTKAAAGGLAPLD
jgi:hypothetical protein